MRFVVDIGVRKVYFLTMAIEKVTTKITADALARLRRISEKTGEKMYAILDRLLWDEEINVINREEKQKLAQRRQWKPKEKR